MAEILRPGRNVWRIAPADRAAVLVDGAALFAAVRQALLQARHSVFVVGWDIDSRTRLVGETGTADDGLPIAFVDFINAIVTRRPELQVHLLLWDFSVVYANERELFPTIALNWGTPPQVKFCLDNQAPLGSSQHQKIIVIDDALAFSGGLDLTIRRWDTSDHRIDHPLRVDPAGNPYRPFHDVQAMVDGEAARALAELVRARWERAACAPPPPLQSGGDIWPQSIVPDFTDVTIGIARTQPRTDATPEVREVEQLFLDSIKRAERCIYIENQFLTSTLVARRIARRLRRRRDLEVLIVVPRRHDSWLEARTMRNGRIRVTRMLKQAGGERVRIVYPRVSDGERATDTMVHSKVMVIDDCFLRIGSANINNRSMGTDSECDVAIEAHDKATQRAIARIRNRLIGEHCGVGAEEVERVLARTGSLVAVADTLTRNGHALEPVDDGEPDRGELVGYIEEVADPDRPLCAERLLDRLRARISRHHLGRFVRPALLVIAALLLTLAWHYSPLADFADADGVRRALDGFAAGWQGPFVILAVFVAGGLIAFPVVVLIMATAAVFGPYYGFVYATCGALASALVTYGLGAKLGRKALRGVLGPRLDSLRARVVRQGVLAVVAIRVVPLAPFTLVNLIAGASEIKLFDYMAGTLIGMLPGLIALSALGHQAFRLLTEPTPGGLLLLVAAVAGWLAISFAIQVAVSKLWSHAR